MPENKSSSLDTLRVIGSPQGFAVYDNASRKLNVMALDLFIRPGNAPLMQIAMPAGNIDVVGKALFAIVDLATGKPRIVTRITWADGETTDFPVPEKAESVVNSANVHSGNGAGEAAGSPVGAEQENVQADAAQLMGDA